MEQQFCTKCGSEIKNDIQKFCVKCGTQFIQSNDAVESSPQNENWLKRIFTKDPITFWICVVATAVFLPPMIGSLFQQQETMDQSTLLPVNQEINNEDDAEDTKIDNRAIDPNQVTNPAYKAKPDRFVIDNDKKISDLPRKDAMVWIESIDDENTVFVSYIISKSGVDFITFATIDLERILDTDDECRSEQGKLFLERFIKAKPVYFEQKKREAYERPDIVDKINKRTEGSLFLKEEYVDLEEVRNVMAMVKDDNNRVIVDLAQVLLGYGIKWFGVDSPESWHRMNSAQEVAQATKRGIFSACPPLTE